MSLSSLITPENARPSSVSTTTVTCGRQRGVDPGRQGDAGKPIGERLGLRRAGRTCRTDGRDPIQHPDDVLGEGVGPFRVCRDEPEPSVAQERVVMPTACEDRVAHPIGVGGPDSRMPQRNLVERDDRRAADAGVGGVERADERGRQPRLDQGAGDRVLHRPVRGPWAGGQERRDGVVAADASERLGRDTGDAAVGIVQERGERRGGGPIPEGRHDVRRRVPHGRIAIGEGASHGRA